MKVPLVFFAHPVGASTPEGVLVNLKLASAWLAYLLDREPDYDITAPWLGTLLSGVERDEVPAQRERGLRCTSAVAARCDGIVLCGGRITAGMQRELDAVCNAGGWVSDLTSLGVTLPASEYATLTSATAKTLKTNSWSTSPILWGREKWSAR